jgi:hypothetical protein
MGSNYSGSHLLPEILDRLGMGVKDSESGLSGNLLGNLLPARRWGSYAIKSLENLMSVGVIEKFKQFIPEEIWDTWTRHLLTLGNNWKRSRAFCLPNDFTGAIRINLKGREPHGLVEQGREYNALCDALVKELSALENADTGKKAVKEVLRVDELYHGENLWDLPDLIVKWAGDAPIRTIHSSRIGTVSGVNPDSRTGGHKTYSFLIASGKHIARGKAIEGASIMDIAPTVLYLMGQPIPKDMDGKVLLDIIDEDFKSNNPVRYS